MRSSPLTVVGGTELPVPTTEPAVISVFAAACGPLLLVLLCRHRDRVVARLARDHFGQFAKVLSNGGQQELVACTEGAAQPQAVELEDAREMGEEHLDLLPLAARL